MLLRSHMISGVTCVLVGHMCSRGSAVPWVNPDYMCQGVRGAQAYGRSLKEPLPFFLSQAPQLSDLREILNSLSLSLAVWE